jgi:hypothetical protein
MSTHTVPKLDRFLFKGASHVAEYPAVVVLNIQGAVRLKSDHFRSFHTVRCGIICLALL